METILLPYGKDKIPLNIPRKNLLKICLLKDALGVRIMQKRLKKQ